MDGLSVKLRGPTFDSLCPVTPLLNDLMSSSSLRQHRVHIWCTCIHSGKTLIPMKIRKQNKKKLAQCVKMFYHK